jgi:hypothetical protein
MNQVVAKPILGLDTEFPDVLYLLYHPSSDRYGCYCHRGVHGVACFSDERSAFQFAEFIDLGGMACKSVSFDQAREIAKARPNPVVALMLLDDLNKPEIHYVK